MATAIDHGCSAVPDFAQDEGALGPIIYFGSDWFAENRTSSHHIARRLADSFPLLYVETPGLRAPKATSRDVRKLSKKLRLAVQSPHKVGPQMWLITVPQIPFRRLPLAQKINRWIGERLVKRAMCHLQFSSPILWFMVPHPAALVGRLGERFVIYYCIDDYASLPGVDVREIERMDQTLTAQAHQVFVSSAMLLKQKLALNPATGYNPHGVDFSLFRQSSDPSLPIAKPAKTLPRPIIGFFGLVESWIDLDLILFLARKRPNWTFLLIGRVAVELGELALQENVVFTGPQPYDGLPAWAKAFDVAIVPYRQNRQVLNSSPLKVKEYLATGKPVVSVRTLEVEHFAGQVHIADSYGEFLSHIEEALASDSELKQRRRMDAVSSMSWDACVKRAVSVSSRRMKQIRGETFEGAVL
jgi:glycosyltransferase involved in cell wall biosynthesis